MSVQATTWVWQHSTAQGTALLVLLAVADAANAEGRRSCQAVSTIAAMARCSERTVQRALRDLEASGDLKAAGVDPTYRTTVYELPGVAPQAVPARPRQRAVQESLGVTVEAAEGDTQRMGGVTGGAAGGDTTVTPYPSNPRTTPQNPKKGDAERVAADAIATAVYEQTDHAARYVIVRAIAAWALKHRAQHSPEQVTAAMVALYRAGKPITQALLGQALDGIIRLPGFTVQRNGYDDRTAGRDYWANGGQFVEEGA